MNIKAESPVSSTTHF